MEKKYKDAEWLKTEYLVKHRSCDDIGWECGVSRMTVYRWLMRLGIPVRRQAQAVAERWWSPERLCAGAGKEKP